MRGVSHIAKRLVAAATVLSVLLTCTFANADSYADDMSGGILDGVGDFGTNVLIGLGVVVEISILSYSLYEGLNNAAYAGGGELPPVDVRVHGWITGALNLAIGVGMLAIDKGDTPAFLGLGIGHLVVGGMNVGFTAWSSSQPESKRRLTVNPVVMRDIEGNPAVGIGLNLVNW